MTKKKVICLKCQQPFISKDPKTNRICRYCHRYNSKIRDLKPTKNSLKEPQ